VTKVLYVENSSAGAIAVASSWRAPPSQPDLRRELPYRVHRRAARLLQVCSGLIANPGRCSFGHLCDIARSPLDFRFRGGRADVQRNLLTNPL
jgi:hypothetical protein